MTYRTVKSEYSINNVIIFWISCEDPSKVILNSDIPRAHHLSLSHPSFYSIDPQPLLLIQATASSNLYNLVTKTLEEPFLDRQLKHYRLFWFLAISRVEDTSASLLSTFPSTLQSLSMTIGISKKAIFSFLFARASFTTIFSPSTPAIPWTQVFSP